MKTIYAISGSAGEPSSNRRMLQSIAHSFDVCAHWQIDELLQELPLYRPALDQKPFPTSTETWREAVGQADAVIICTPEYLHNLPAILKSGLEWLKNSGELYEKPVLPITFTPHEPRGKYAMPSLCHSLVALKARVVAELPLYKTDFQESDGRYNLEGDQKEMISAALELLGV